MTSDILTQKLCDRLRNLCLNSLIEAKLKNCWTKALASKVVYSYLRDMYRQQKLTRICLKKIHTDTHTCKDIYTHTHTYILIFMGFPDSSEGKEWRVCLQRGRPGFDDSVWKIPWRRKWQSTLVFLPGKSHGWRSLACYSPRGLKESDMTNTHTWIYVCMFSHSLLSNSSDPMDCM